MPCGVNVIRRGCNITDQNFFALWEQTLLALVYCGKRMQSKVRTCVTNQMFDNHDCIGARYVADATWSTVLPLTFLNGCRYAQILAEGCMVCNGLLGLAMVFGQPLSAMVAALLARPAAKIILDADLDMC